MRILWFTNTPSLYKKDGKHEYNGGGWIESLQSIVTASKDIELAIAFKHPDSVFKVIEDDVVYYPVNQSQSVIKKVQDKFFVKRKNENELNIYNRIINDFQPDLIHVFGSESNFGLIGEELNIPIVLHVQGIINPYLNAWFPPSFSYASLVSMYGFNFLKSLKIFSEYYSFIHNAKQERKIMKVIPNYMGRTKWDKSVVSLMSPNSKYYYCSEILRPVFYNQKTWQVKQRKKVIITSTISSPFYKGYDLILKSAKILFNQTDLLFEWNIYGFNSFEHIEKHLKIKSKDYSIQVKGVINAPQLVEALLDSDLFVHPSYIDNSPNSICEAQILGLPIISTNVGGISSLIKSEYNGILIPSNDPYSLASSIINLSVNKELATKLGANAHLTAIERHDVKTISSDLFNIYKVILNDEN